MNEQRNDETLLDHSSTASVRRSARSSHVARQIVTVAKLRMIESGRAPTAAYLLRFLTPSALSAPCGAYEMTRDSARSPLRLVRM